MDALEPLDLFDLSDLEARLYARFPIGTPRTVVEADLPDIEPNPAGGNDLFIGPDGVSIREGGPTVFCASGLYIVILFDEAGNVELIEVRNSSACL